MVERLPWFPCYQTKLLGALAGMPPDSGYVYMVVILRTYEVEGVCPDSIEVLSRRTGMTKARVQKAIDWLVEHRKLEPVSGGLKNPFAIEVLTERNQVSNRLSLAGKKGGKKRAEKAQLKQTNHPSQVKARLKPPSSKLHLESQLQLDSKDSEKEPADDWPNDYGEQFWNRYPPGRKQDRAKVTAKLAQLRASKTVTWTVLIAGLNRFVLTSPDPKFTAAPIVWLNNGRWDADYGNRTGGGPNAPTINDQQLGFAGIARRLRNSANPDAGRPPPEDLEPINRH
jgi:hypothetical protein